MHTSTDIEAHVDFARGTFPDTASEPVPQLADSRRSRRRPACRPGLNIMLQSDVAAIRLPIQANCLPILLEAMIR